MLRNSCSPEIQEAVVSTRREDLPARLVLRDMKRREARAPLRYRHLQEVWWTRRPAEMKVAEHVLQ